MPKPSDARRRDTGAELRKWREAAGLTGLDLAHKTGWDPSTVSRLESGQAPLSETAVMIYLAHCGVSAADVAQVLQLAKETEDGYLVRRGSVRTLILHETTARTIRSVAPLLVPGLLQTEEYIRAVMALSGSLDDADVESRIEVRLARQELLLRRWPSPPNVTYFLYEGALRGVVGDNRVMNEQMLHLTFVGERSHVTIRVVPFGVGGPVAATGPMTLMNFTNHDPVLYLENRFSGLFVERAEDIAKAEAILAQVGEVALDVPQSRELLVQLASEYDQPQGVS